MRRMEHEEIAFSVDVVTADDGRVVITPSGELDMATQGELRAVLERAAAESSAVTLDLGELRFLDTSGLRLILETAEASRRDGFAFSVLPGAEPVQRLFAIAGVTDLVPFDDRA
jgi:anti-anti-sigma factor